MSCQQLIISRFSNTRNPPWNCLWELDSPLKSDQVYLLIVCGYLKTISIFVYFVKIQAKKKCCFKIWKEFHHLCFCFFCQELKKLGLGSEVDLQVYEVPVEYQTVQSLVPSLWKQYHPQVIGTLSDLFPFFSLFKVQVLSTSVLG